MQGTVHLLAGAAIALLVPDSTTMVTVAFFSHFILDLSPHIDPETFADDISPYTFRQRLALIVDILIVVLLMIALLLLHEQRINVILGAIVAQLADLMSPLEQYASFSPFRRFHYLFHWEPKRANRWSWYIAGLLLPLSVSAASLGVILTY